MQTILRTFAREIFIQKKNTAHAKSSIRYNVIEHLQEIVVQNKWQSLVEHGDHSEVQNSLCSSVKFKLIVKARYIMKSLMIIEESYQNNTAITW